MLSPTQIEEIVKAHDNYWNDRRSRMRELRNMYMTDFWGVDRSNKRFVDTVLRTEVPKAYAVVESFLGSLYAKNPAVVVTPDLRARGNPQVAAATANTYLGSVRAQVEDATRLALIYPCSFVKLAPTESVDPLKRVVCSALAPWEVIVDATASSWDQQRFVGHVYLMPLEEALRRYSKSAPDFNTRNYDRWIDAVDVGGRASVSAMMGQEGSSDAWVRIVEVYDLLNDKLLVWSPDYAQGSEYLFSGVKVQVGALNEPKPAGEGEEGTAEEVEEVHETTGIPYKSASGRPIVPIIPLYFSRDPDAPLRGYSLVARSYDQFRELNVMRTYNAQGVRRMARQWMMRAGFLSEEAAAKVAMGVDGEIIEVDLPPGATLDGNITPVPQTPIPADLSIYAATVENDIREAGLLAPFTRGEVTKATATEQNLLANYTSSEIGRMARTRDEVISSIARVYNVMLSVILGDEAEPLALPNPIGPTMLSATDLTGDFGYFAVDAGTTPMADMAKRQALTQLAPLLIQLGVNPAMLRDELVRTYQLPDSFTKVEELEQTEATEAAIPTPETGA